MARVYWFFEPVYPFLLTFRKAIRQHRPVTELAKPSNTCTPSFNFMKQVLQQISVVTLLVLSFSSCVNTKKLSQEAIYFQHVTDSSLRTSLVNYESVVQKGDILGIKVMTANEASARLLNQQTVSA